MKILLDNSVRQALQISLKRRLAPVTILFIGPIFFLHPLVVIAAGALLRNPRCSISVQAFLATSLAVFFVSRPFGVPLGGGAFDDIPQYVFLFESAHALSLQDLIRIWTFEPGYVVYTNAVSALTQSPIIFLAITFFLISFLLIRSASNILHGRIFLAMLVVLASVSVNTYTLMHILRQSLAVAIAIYAISLSPGRANETLRHPVSLLFLVASSFIHISTLPILIAYVVVKLIRQNSRTGMALLLVASATISLIAPFILQTISIYSTRVSGYSSDLKMVDLPVFQLAYICLTSAFFITLVFSRRLKPRTHELSIISIALGVSFLFLCLSPDVPDRLLVRQMTVVCLFHSFCLGTVVAEMGQSSRLAWLLPAFCSLNVVTFLINPPAHLLPFHEQMSLGFFSGFGWMVYMLSTYPTSIPSYIGFGTI